MSVDTNRFADDITEFTVKIQAYDGRLVDISDLVSSVQIFQSIHTPALTAKLIINDRTNFLNTFPLNGEEVIKLTFDSISNAKKTEMDLFIFGCEDIDINPSLMSMSYTLYCSSYEALFDTYHSIRKAYRQQISASVRDIYSTFLRTQKQLDIEETQGNPTLIIPNLSPFQALAFLQKRAVSATSVSSVFVSYETTNGFAFKTIEKLVKDGKQKATNDPDYQYVLDHAVLIDQTRTVLSKNLLVFKPQRKFSTAEEIQAGAFYSQALKYDMMEKTAAPVEYKLSSSYPRWNVLSGTGSLASALHTSKFITDFSADSMRNYAFMYDKNRDEPSLADNVGVKGSYISNLLQNQFEMIIPGNNKLVPGDVIKVSIPNLSTNNDEHTNYEQRMDGLFLIAEMTHSVLGKSKFYTKLLCYKDSYAQ